MNRAAQLLSQASGSKPLDELLREAIKAHTFWSPLERRMLVRTVQSYYRWVHWLDSDESLQTQAAAAVEMQDRFEKSESLVKVEALRARAVPEWLATEMEVGPDFLRQLQRQPALWLRTRIGKRSEVAEALGDCAVVDYVVPGTELKVEALRYNGDHDLFRTDAFQNGLFEIQDLSSQCVSRVCDPQAGETWWDACAGQGGKTLHLGELMCGKGMVWASDRSAKRLAMLKKRAGRAELFNYRSATWEGEETLPVKTPFDGVLIDAPCAGTGTWQRNPQARWTTSPKDVAELTVIQSQLLKHTAPAVKVGGKLVYSVCTLTRSETTAIAVAFTAANPGFALVQTVTLVPGALDANGMFIAVWKRNA